MMGIEMDSMFDEPRKEQWAAKGFDPKSDLLDWLVKFDLIHLGLNGPSGDSWQEIVTVTIPRVNTD
jgi:hypothetical protein